MQRLKATNPTAIIIFGVTGDLANRKLLPALFHLFSEDWVDKRSIVIGVGRKHLSRAEFQDKTKKSVTSFYHSNVSDQKWYHFADRLFYHETNFDDLNGFEKLAKDLAQLDKEAGKVFTRVFYLSTPASLYDDIVDKLKEAKLNSDSARIVIEKPFGSTLASAQILNKRITTSFKEKQIYRIDHYLGKEVVQNIMAFRFANGIFEPIWNRNYIDNIQITVAESIGIEQRGRFYEETGALRDFAQNHLMQLIAHTAMEQPNSFQAEAIRDERIRVLNAIQIPDPKKIDDISIRGQYSEGLQEGELKPSYLQEENISTKSTTETYFALKLFIENERWSGVPFYLRHGKRLRQRVSEISIQFKYPPQHLFETEPNVLSLRIQPDEQVGIRIVAKQPGYEDILTPVNMHFNYQEAFQANAPEAYERLLLDVIDGNQMLFIRNDAVEASWRIIDAIRDGWEEYSKNKPYSYATGTWGPESANRFIEKDGRRWLLENAPMKVG
jgi:glucose-6-phosphate 1-dehydrogenase